MTHDPDRNITMPFGKESDVAEYLVSTGKTFDEVLDAEIDKAEAGMGLNWQTMDSALKDRPILVLTSDFGIVQAEWDVSVTNFYKSQIGWASYDPENSQGDWVSEWCVMDADRRLYCGATPQFWAKIGELPPPREVWPGIEKDVREFEALFPMSTRDRV